MLVRCLLFFLLTFLSIFSHFLENILNSDIWKIFFVLISLIIWIFLSIYFANKNRVKLENKKFEKYFDVISENQIEARRIITPKMMEKLIELKEKSKLPWLWITFYWNDIYIKFNVWNFLEFNLLNTNIWNQVLAFVKQINLIIDFVNFLNIEYFSQIEFQK